MAGETGWLVPPDDVDALARDAAARTSAGSTPHAIRRNAERFSTEVFQQQPAAGGRSPGRLTEPDAPLPTRTWTPAYVSDSVQNASAGRVGALELPAGRRSRARPPAEHRRRRRCLRTAGRGARCRGGEASVAGGRRARRGERADASLVGGDPPLRRSHARVRRARRHAPRGRQGGPPRPAAGDPAPGARPRRRRTHVRYRGATKAVRGTDSRARGTRDAVAHAADEPCGRDASAHGVAAARAPRPATYAGAHERADGPEPRLREPAAPAPWSTLRPPILNGPARADAVRRALVLAAAVAGLPGHRAGQRPARRRRRQLQRRAARTPLGQRSMLAAAGVRRARVEFGWDSMRYDDPARSRTPARSTRSSARSRRNGIRPLLLLNAHHGAPGPVVRHHAAAGRAGTRRLRTVSVLDRRRCLGRARAHRVQCARRDLQGRGRAHHRRRAATGPRRSPSRCRAISRPATTPATHPALRARSRRRGAPTAARTRRSSETLAGWLQYVGAITAPGARGAGRRRVRRRDLERAQLRLGLPRRRPLLRPVPAALRGTATSTRAILERTVAFLRDPAQRRRGHRDRRRLRQRAAVAVRRDRARRGDRDRQAPVSAGARLSGGPPAQHDRGRARRPADGLDAARCARSSPSTGSAACRPRRWCATSRPPPRSCTARRTAATPAPPAARRRSCG